MSFDWLKYIILAKECAKRTEEEYLRTAISRAYYGAFCFLRDEKGIITKNYSSGQHQIVIETYKFSGNKYERQIGDKLAKLKKQREDADYDSNKQIISGDIKRALLRADEIMKLFRKI